MGYSIGTGRNGRDIGYGVPAICDSPKCSKRIDRGMSYCCGGYGQSDMGCGLYFCSDHLYYHKFRGEENYTDFCIRCIRHRMPYEPKPDILEWVAWKLYDESWKEWREENKEKVERLKIILISNK